MPDFSVVTTVISTTGTLLGALGGAALAHWVNLRREETQFNRQRKDQRAHARQQAYGELLSTATRLRSSIEIAGQQHWKDMNVRLTMVQEHALSAHVHASRVALLSPEMTDVAFALAKAAVRLAATTGEHTEMGYQGEQFLGGQIIRPVDFKEFDECFKRFSNAMAQHRDG